MLWRRRRKEARNKQKWKHRRCDFVCCARLLLWRVPNPRVSRHNNNEALANFAASKSALRAGLRVPSPIVKHGGEILSEAMSERPSGAPFQQMTSWSSSTTMAKAPVENYLAVCTVVQLVPAAQRSVPSGVSLQLKWLWGVEREGVSLPYACCELWRWPGITGITSVQFIPLWRASLPCCFTNTENQIPPKNRPGSPQFHP